MWPFTKRPKASLTSQARAYLKQAIPPDEGDPPFVISEADAPILRDLGNGLLVSYLVDQKFGFQYIAHRHLQEDGVSEQELHAIALKNLASFANTPDRLRVQPYGSIFATFLDGNFEASLILWDHLWDVMLRPFVAGQYAVAIPARDILSFCDASSADGLQELQAVIDRVRAANGDHPISDHIYVRVGKSWQPTTALP